MKTVLNVVSIAASFTVAISVLYLIQYYTIGMIPIMKQWTVGRFYVKDLLFLMIAFIIIIEFFDVYMPY
ncbi:hypothetical protein [Spirosoma linguale]|uniref:Uncharacterized protein n=1 Tax=Spirosoma linguale (strain ATCC 33905 / DSM 74 / LMG 10896 / Claus 1) TaxID=504472 RepID=D2QEU8_SPILD|nr:hypothetical protein Slin_5323 [Spirosoma linguale DSM 74]